MTERSGGEVAGDVRPAGTGATARRRAGHAAVVLAAIAAGPCVAANAQSAAGPPGGLVREVKLGVLHHDTPELWSGFRLEPQSADVNVEVLLAPHVHVLGGVLMPAVGATLNTRGATSKAYAGARWEIEGPAGLFLALGLGAAVHNGETGPVDPHAKALGGRVLFHIPAEIGWRWDGHNSLSVYFEHISNGYTQTYNEGLDSIGIRYGYRF